MTADDLFNALIVRYPAREYALLAQVRNCTGFARPARTADALCMSLWPSRGLELIGIEIKIDRQDWMREKADPEKADAIGRFCDGWWIATPPGVVQIEELPPAWGLMEYNEAKKKWNTRKPASNIKAKPITKEFLAAVLRNVSENSVPHSAIQGKIQEGVTQARSTENHRVKGLEDENQALKKRILEFETASGISIGHVWSYQDPKAIGLAVRQVLNGDHKRIAGRLQSLRDTATNIVQDITRRLEGAVE